MREAQRKILVEAFEPDTVILREGEPCDYMYKILSGAVELYLRYGTAEEHLIGIASGARCFGEHNLLTGQPCAYTVVAYNKVLVERIHRDALEEFVRTNPQNAIEIMTSMARSGILMQKNMDILLDELNAKDKQKKSSLEIQNAIMQYRVNALRQLL